MKTICDFFIIFPISVIFGCPIHTSLQYYCVHVVTSNSNPLRIFQRRPFVGNSLPLNITTTTITTTTTTPHHQLILCLYNVKTHAQTVLNIVVFSRSTTPLEINLRFPQTAYCLSSLHPGNVDQNF